MQSICNFSKALTALTIFIFCSSFAQDPCLVKEWEFTYGGNETDLVRETIEMADGSFVLAGESNSTPSGEMTDVSRGQYDGWVVKIDALGGILWNRRYGGNYSDNFTSVAETVDGGLIFAGLTRSDSSGEVSEHPFAFGVDDMWVVRTNANGDVLWDKRYGGTNLDWADKIIALADGTFYVAGTSNSGISGNKTSALRGGFDYWCLHIDASGNILWDAAIGGTDTDFLTSAVPAASINGGVALSGYSLSSIGGDKSEASRGLQDFWVVVLTASGTLDWEARYGGSSSDLAWDIVREGNGYLVGGVSSSPVGDEVSTIPYSTFDGWAVEIDNAGTLAEDRRYGGDGSDEIRCMAKALPSDPFSNILIGGLTLSNVSGTISGAPRGGEDYFFTTTAYGGAILEDGRCGGTDYDRTEDILYTSDGGILLCGNSTSNAGADKSENSRGGHDMWIVKVGHGPLLTWYKDSDGDGYGTPDISTLACSAPFEYVENMLDCDDTNSLIYITAPCDDGDPLTGPDVIDPLCMCAGAAPRMLALRMILDGAYDLGSGMMKDDLRVLGLLPAIEPYSNLGWMVTENPGDQVGANMLGLIGPDAIVDHVLIELRDPQSPDVIVASRAALLQRDGDVVELDGNFPVQMDAPSGNYYVAIQHRNHFGVLTGSTVNLNAQPLLIDLSDPQIPVFGTNARKMLGNAAVLWSGDINADGSIKYTGQDNDRDAILLSIGGAVPTTVNTGYLSEDINLDGNVKYTGMFNDRDIVLQNIGGNTPTTVITEQLP